MIRRTVLLDTCVWRDAAHDRAWLRRISAVRETEVAVTAENVEELVVTALTTGLPEEFEEVRVACRLIDRYASQRLPPAVWHLARSIGLDPGAVPDPASVCDLVAGCTSQSALRELASQDLPTGGLHEARLSEWPRMVRSEKQHWLDSIGSALEEFVPGIMTARQRGEPVRMDDADYLRGRLGLLSDSSGLVVVEIEKMRRTLLDLDADWDAPALRARLRAALAVFGAVFTEAILDRFDGPHNPNTPKVQFKPNDWYDLAQLRYLQDDRCWVTSDARWPAIARRAGHGDTVLAPADLK